MTKKGKKNPIIREKALELTRYVRPKDWRGQVLALFEFVRDRIRYTRDIRDVETLHEAQQVLAQQQGDCDDKAILLAALLESIGHPTRFVAVGFQPNHLSHVLTETRIGPQWIALDPTEPHPMGWRPPGIVYSAIQKN